MPFTAPAPTGTHQEIQQRLRKRFLERLAQRVKRMRKQLLERAWEELKVECRQLQDGGDSFGFKILTQLATDAEEALSSVGSRRAQLSSSARQGLDRLMLAIDDILTENRVLRD